MSFLRSLRLTALEAGAYAKQAMLLARDLAPIVPKEVRPGEDVVVLIHGLFASAGVLRPMRAALERHRGLHVASFSYPPGPGAEALADRLASLLVDVPDEASIHLVGHSMGGIVARHYAVFRDDPRVRSTTALATPFGGVRGAELLGVPFARDIDRESALLRKLRLATGARSIPHLSIVAGGDALTRTPVSHALPGGEVVVLDDLGHNSVLFDRRAIALVERRILETRG